MISMCCLGRARGAQTARTRSPSLDGAGAEIAHLVGTNRVSLELIFIFFPLAVFSSGFAGGEESRKPTVVFGEFYLVLDAVFGAPGGNILLAVCHRMTWGCLGSRCTCHVNFGCSWDVLHHSMSPWRGAQPGTTSYPKQGVPAPLSSTPCLQLLHFLLSAKQRSSQQDHAFLTFGPVKTAGEEKDSAFVTEVSSSTR